jgi:hypothetical protein
LADASGRYGYWDFKSKHIRGSLAWLRSDYEILGQWVVGMGVVDTLRMCHAILPVSFETPSAMT